jgi:hypothetical protein
MKFAIPLLLTYRNRKTQKLTKTSENNKAKGLTSANQGVQIHNIWHSSQTHEFHYSEDEARYKIVTLTCTDAVVVPCSLTCSPTRTLPNQVSYLKGSSMKFLTLEPTSKIDFSCSAAHLKWLQSDLELL